MPAIASFKVVALDCPDCLALARFYSEVTGWTVAADSDAEWAKLEKTTGRPSGPAASIPSRYTSTSPYPTSMPVRKPS